MTDIISIKCIRGQRIININDIIYCQAKNIHTDIFLTSEKGSAINCGKTLKEIENILPENLFARCHRSFLVNISYVKFLHRKDNKIILRNKKTIKLSKNGYKKVKKLLN